MFDQRKKDSLTITDLVDSLIESGDIGWVLEKELERTLVVCVKDKEDSLIGLARGIELGSEDDLEIICEALEVSALISFVEIMGILEE